MNHVSGIWLVSYVHNFFKRHLFMVRYILKTVRVTNTALNDPEWTTMLINVPFWYYFQHTTYRWLLGSWLWISVHRCQCFIWLTQTVGGISVLIHNLLWKYTFGDVPWQCFLKVVRYISGRKCCYLLIIYIPVIPCFHLKQWWFPENNQIDVAYGLCCPWRTSCQVDVWL